MLAKLIDWSARNRALVLLATLFITLGGIYAVLKTPLDAIPELVDQVRRLTAMWGKQSVYCWITVNRVRHFLVHGGVQGDPDVAIPTSVWTQDGRAHVFKDKWWLMSGDTDFR